MYIHKYIFDNIVKSVTLYSSFVMFNNFFALLYKVIFDIISKDNLVKALFQCTDSVQNLEGHQLLNVISSDLHFAYTTNCQFQSFIISNFPLIDVWRSTSTYEEMWNHTCSKL